MMRWLEANPIGQVLAAVAGGLVVVSLVLGVVGSLPPEGSVDEAGGGDGSFQVDVPTLPGSQPIEAFAVVTDRPLFNESRQPELELDAGEESLEDEISETVVDAPELELAGVIITPTLRMVTLREKKARESLVAFEGQPLEGDYGTWHVSRIAPREITLASGDGEELQLQLQVHDAKIAPPPKPEPQERTAEQQAADAGGDSDRPLTRAEEIRQRIAERREELRRAAEAEESEQEQEPIDYRSAIQKMVAGRKKQADNDDEQ